MKKILAASEHPGSTNAILGIIQRLINDKKAEVTVAACGPAEDIFSKSDMPFKRVEDRSFLYIDSLVGEYDPDLILTGNAPEEVIDKQFTLSGKQREKVTLSVLDFPAYYHERFSGATLEDRFKFMPDRLVVLNETVVKEMIAQGFNPSKLLPHGQPYFDDISSLKSQWTNDKIQETRSVYGISMNERVLVFLSQPKSIDPDPRHYQGFTEISVLELLSKTLNDINEDLTLLVKLHPRDNFEGIRDASHYKGRTIFAGKAVNLDYDTRKTMASSNLIAGMNSTALIEAVYLDLDAISIQPNLTVPDSLYTNGLNCSVAVYREEDLRPKLMKVLYDSTFRSEIRQNRASLSLDGEAAERTVMLIYKMLNIQ